METTDARETSAAGTAAPPRWDFRDGAGDEPLVLDRYRLLRRLGRGGMGVVWLAHDEKLGRQVAVKRIPAADEDTAKRAAREGRIAAKLQHPAIVALYETGADADAAYLVSEVVHGPTYAELLEHGALSDRDVVEIGLALCDALTHAHKQGVVHRDVKPQNVLIPDNGDSSGPPAKLTDFGIARIAGDDALTRTGDVVGTLAYMAPEQAEGRECGPSADLYALGLCVYEGLAGVNPIRGRGAGSTARRVGQRLPPLGRLRRDLPLELCDAVDAAVWPHEDERGTIGELKAALKAARGDVDDEPGTIAGGPLEPIAPLLPPRRTAFPERGLAALLAGGLTAAVLGTLAAADTPWWWFALGAAALVGVLPRLGWVATAIAVIAWVATEAPGATAWALAAAAAPVPLLLRNAAPPAWSLPGLAPGMAWGSLAGAFPALAGQLARPHHRAAAAALGAWWVLLRDAGDVPGALGHAELATVGVWAAAAAVLPYLVRGRLLVVDLVAATAWAATLAAGTQAAIGAPPEGLIAGAVAAGALAVAFAASRGGADAR